MPIDPSIPLGIRPQQIVPLQIQTPLDRYQKMLTLRHLMDQGQLGALNLEQTRLENERLQRTAQEEQNLGSWMKQNQQRPDLTPQEIVSAHPNPTGIKFATAWSAQKTAELTQHKAFLDNAFEEAKTDDRIYNSVTPKDPQSKYAALTELVRLKRLTGEQAAQIAGLPDEEFQSLQQRAAAQSLDRLQRIKARQDEIALRIAQNTEASATAGGIAEGEKKVLDTAQAQKAADAAMVAAGFEQGPQAGAVIIAALGKIDPKRAEPFKDVTTAAQAINAGLTPEQLAAGERAAAQLEQGSYGKTKVYPPPVQAQKVEEAAAMAGARQNVLDSPEKIAQEERKARWKADLDIELEQRKAALLGAKPMSAEAATKKALVDTLVVEGKRLQDIIRRDGRKAIAGILTGLDTDISRKATNFADLLGRLRSQGAVSLPEESRFQGMIARWGDLRTGDMQPAIDALDSIMAEAGRVSTGINPKGGPPAPPTGQKVKVWNEQTGRFEER